MGDSLPSNHALLIWCYKNAALIFKLCSLFGRHVCFLFFKFTLASGVFTRAGVVHRLMEATLSCLLRTELSHPCILSSYSPGYRSRILLINNTSCAVNDKRQSMSSSACSFIYADLCDSFFTYRPFVLLFPSGLGNQPWRYFCIFSEFSLQMSTPLSEVLL